MGGRDRSSGFHVVCDWIDHVENRAVQLIARVGRVPETKRPRLARP